MGAEDRKAVSPSCGRQELEAGMSGRCVCRCVHVLAQCALYVCDGPVCAGEVNEYVCMATGECERAYSSAFLCLGRTVLVCVFCRNIPVEHQAWFCRIGELVLSWVNWALLGDQVGNYFNRVLVGLNHQHQLRQQSHLQS